MDIDCTQAAETFSRIATKWTYIVILVLAELERCRFNEIRRMIPGITQRMLVITLRNLEREGIISRQPSLIPAQAKHSSGLARVDYELTHLGRGLQKPIESLSLWVFLNFKEMREARAEFDRRKKKVAVPAV